ncbi:MAG: CDP-alcohol phosphatidyltransferase family protein [Mycoplasmatales bacterium]
MSISKINLATYVSLVSLLLSSLVIYGAFSKTIDFNTQVLLIIGCGVVDMLDGKVARRYNRNENDNIFGVQVDSLVDVISFGAAPAVMFLAWNVNFLVVFFFMMCAVLRLAYYNTYSANSTERRFTGLPTTSIVVTLPLTLIAINNSPDFLMYLTIYVVAHSFLMISNLHFKKPGPRMYPFMFALGVFIVYMYMIKGVL